MAISQGVYKSSLNITKISSSVFSINKQLDDAGTTALKINKTLLKRSTDKKTSIDKDRILFVRRRENVRRKEQESIIESSGIGGAVRRQGKIISDSTKGFLGRMLDFVGTLFVGWLLNNLPTIIGLAKELIARIQKLVGILNTFINATGTIFNTLGSSLGAIFSDIVKFQFTFPETRAKFEKSMFELEDAFSQLTSSFDEAVKLFTTPLTTQEGEGSYSGENVPAPGSTWGGQESAPSSGGANPTDLKGGARLLMQKGFPAKGAAYLAGNIQQESGWKAKRKPWVLSDGAGTNKGLISWNRSRIVAAEKFLGKPLETASASEQIDWIKHEMSIPYYNSGSDGVYKVFMNPNATEDQLKAASKRYIVWGDLGERWKYSQVAYDYLQKEGTNPPAPQSTKTQTKFASLTGDSGDSMGNKPLSTPISPFLPGKSGPITSGFGYRWGKMHRGYDVGVPVGTPVYAYFPGIVTKTGYDERGYGYYIEWRDSVHNQIHFFGHLKEMPKISQGQKFDIGTVLGFSGNTGRSTAPHLHWEIGPQGSQIDPGQWLRTVGAKQTPVTVSSTTSTKPSSSPAQVATQRPKATAVAGQVTQERRGPTVVVAPQAPTPTPSAMGGYAGSSGSKTIVLDPLNRYITNKLLLELAYT